MTDRLVGAQLGAYEIRELLGSGGMGSVYRGYDPALAREVAIKVIQTGGLLPDAVERFRREARLAANLRHPHIVQIYAFGEDAGRLYMAQELLPGPSLALQLRRMGRRRLAASRVRRIIAQLAAALDHAHGQGIIHRDVKPGNAIYNAAGELVLTDFGIARGDDLHVATTEPGVVMGTPGYVAPEQAVGGRGVTRACDIYALGVLLFELLTGRLPFEADAPMGVILKHLYDDPPAPSSLRPELPRALDTVVLRALQKEPELRHPSAGALAAALAAAWPADDPVENAPSPAKSQRRAEANGALAGNKNAPARQRAAQAETAPRSRSLGGDGAKIGTSPRRPGTQPRPQPGEAARKAPNRKKALAQQAEAAPQIARPADAQALQAQTADRTRRVRVGLTAACAIGILILIGFGIGPNEVVRGWAALARLLFPG